MFWFYWAMDNATLNTTSIRQPAPSVANPNNTPVQRKFKLPNIGIATVPSISKTPLGDTLAIKKQENPRTAYKLTLKNKKGLNFQDVTSLLIAGCSIVALLTFKGKGK